MNCPYYQPPWDGHLAHLSYHMRTGNETPWDEHLAHLSYP
jgi:hypothetical protein